MIFRLINIAFTNIFLSSDNVLIIALFGKHLSRRKRLVVLLGSLLTSLAIQLGILLIMSYLFKITFLQALFGLIICYMAFHLIHENKSDQTIKEIESKNLVYDIWKIAIGNLMMSFENEATLISLANGNPWMAWFGFVLTSPFIFFGSHFISYLLKKYEIIIYIGAAYLFKIGLDLLFTLSIISRYALTGSWVIEVLFIIYLMIIYLKEKDIVLIRNKIR